jgi:hypothetical protein
MLPGSLTRTTTNLTNYTNDKTADFRADQIGAAEKIRNAEGAENAEKIPGDFLSSSQRSLRFNSFVESIVGLHESWIRWPPGKDHFSGPHFSVLSSPLLVAGAAAAR